MANSIPILVESTEPLLTYITGATRESKHFLDHIRKYNSCFHMKSFGSINIVRYGNSKPTLKVQEQLYRQIGSRFPVTEEDSQFMQIYFIYNIEDRKIFTELRA